MVSTLSFLCSWARGGGRSSVQTECEVNNVKMRAGAEGTNWFQLYSTQIQVIYCEIRTVATPLFIWIEHSNENETFNWQFKVVESNQKFYRSLKSVFKKAEREHAQRLHFLSKVFVPGKKCLNCLQPEYWWWPHVSSHKWWWPRGWASVKDESECVMMTPDFRLRAVKIFTIQARTPRWGRLRNIHSWKLMNHCIAEVSSNWAVLLSCLVLGQIEKTSKKSFLMQMKVYLSCPVFYLRVTLHIPLVTPSVFPTNQRPVSESVANQRPEMAACGITCLNELSSHLEFISPPWEHLPHVQWGKTS